MVAAGKKSVNEVGNVGSPGWVCVKPMTNCAAELPFVLGFDGSEAFEPVHCGLWRAKSGAGSPGKARLTGLPGKSPAEVHTSVTSA